MQYPYSEPGPIKELLDTADELDLFSLDELDISSLEELELFSLEELTSTFDEEELLLVSSLEELEFFLELEEAFADEEVFFDDDDSPPLLMLDFASDSETEDSASEPSIFAVVISDSPLHEKRKAVKPTKVTVLFKDIRPHFGKDLFF